MLKNINDYLSFATLIILTIMGLGIFVGIFYKKHEYKQTENLLKLFLDYENNTEE